MRESSLERKLIGSVKGLGGVCLKLPASFYRGIPDRVVLLPRGRVYFVELKTDRGVPSGPQLRWLTLLRALGFSCHLVYGIDELKALVDDFEKVHDLPRSS